METLHDLAQATGGRILPARRIQDAAAAALGRIVTDSRQVESGDIFWALAGPNYDGACFIHEAFRRGAQGAVVSRVETIPDGRLDPECRRHATGPGAMGTLEAAAFHRHRHRRDRQRGQDHDAADDPYRVAEPLEGNGQPAKLQQSMGRAA